MFLRYLLFLIVILAGCRQKKNASKPVYNKADLLTLERNWLTAEFALDTAFISPLIHDSCIGISEDGIHNKQQFLNGMFENISQRNRDSIFVDSFRLENEIVNIYDNSAVVTFIVHTFRKTKGIPNQKRTRFFDVWLKENKSWKLIASQGTPLISFEK